jgi:hypothetical protein
MNPEGRPPRPASERVWSRVEKTPTCWNWIGSKNRYGYGVIAQQIERYKFKVLSAHRVVFEIVNGPIPEGKQLDHLCRNRACVNPAHLEIVTCKENLLRGEGICAKNARKTHCKRGHEFTKENTYIYWKGRMCRTCNRERMREAYQPRTRAS